MNEVLDREKELAGFAGRLAANVGVPGGEFYLEARIS